MDMTGRVVLITGGSRGLGLLLARQFGRLGARVAICARDMDELDRAVTDLTAHGVEVLAKRCDLLPKKRSGGPSSASPTTSAGSTSS